MDVIKTTESDRVPHLLVPKTQTFSFVAKSPWGKLSELITSTIEASGISQTPEFLLFVAFLLLLSLEYNVAESHLP
jgi:hypothetical protein